MQIAVVGAGFSGLAVAWNLLKLKHQVVVFDPLSLSCASAVATGLLHPYVGQEGRRSLFATEALQKTQELLQIAEESLGEPIYRQGIVRIAQSLSQKDALKKHVENFQDITQLDNNSFLVKSGRTVFCKRYLQGLRLAIIEKGGEFVAEKITSLEQLQSFDQVVVATGASIRDFPELQVISTTFIKGQVLTCQVPDCVHIKRSIIGKGYIAVSDDPEFCHVGATYERGDLTGNTNLLDSQRTLFEKVSQFYPNIAQLKPIECSSAIRVMRQGHYLPIAAQISRQLWTLTAMGSRGLLYHAYFGEKLAKAIATLSFQELVYYLK